MPFPVIAGSPVRLRSWPDASWHSVLRLPRADQGFQRCLCADVGFRPEHDPQALAAAVTMQRPSITKSSARLEDPRALAARTRAPNLDEAAVVAQPHEKERDGRDQECRHQDEMEQRDEDAQERDEEAREEAEPRAAEAREDAAVDDDRRAVHRRVALEREGDRDRTGRQRHVLNRMTLWAPAWGSVCRRRHETSNADCYVRTMRDSRCKSRVVQQPTIACSTP